MEVDRSCWKIDQFVSSRLNMLTYTKGISKISTQHPMIRTFLKTEPSKTFRKHTTMPSRNLIQEANQSRSYPLLTQEIGIEELNVSSKYNKL